MASTRRTKQDMAARRLVKQLCAALDDKKAEDIVVLDVSAQSSITNYLILATGNSDPHLRALRIEVDRVMDDSDTQVLGVEADPGSGWTVVDAFDVMVHVFTAETRSRYQIESLWGDAVSLSPKRLTAIRAQAIARRQTR